MFLLEFLALVFLTHAIAGCVAISEASDDMKVIVPPATVHGSKATLVCFYRLEGDRLYSVKWYKDEKEFYRYTPKENPPKKGFNTVPGLNVILSASNETHITLDNVTHENGGEYTCEVTADAPSFFTRLERAKLKIIEVPTYGPHVTGIKTKYRIRELLKAECETRGSRPAANLTWLINGETVNSTHTRHSKPIPMSQGVFSSQSGLRLHVTQNMFSDGEMKLECVANIFDVYKNGFVKIIKFAKDKQRTAATTTQHPESNNDMDYSLPAARYPETTLFFTIQEEAEDASISAAAPMLPTVFHQAIRILIGIMLNVKL